MGWEGDDVSTFGALTTTDEVLRGFDLSGKRVLITGASTGLGLETARTIVAHGGHVVGAVRNLDKTTSAARAAADQALESGQLSFLQLDLESLASVRSFADALLAEGKSFDVVIANAGVMACPFSKTEDGFERQLAANHLGHFVLVNRIANLVQPGGRFIALSSVAHRLSDIDLDDPNFERSPYRAFLAYGRSKTAAALLAVAFDARRRDIDGVRATAIHPGSVQTELMRHITPEIAAEAAELRPAPKKTDQIVRKTPAQGASTIVWAAFVAPAQDIGAKYCEDCHVSELDEDPSSFSGVRGYALEPANAEALWRMSESLVGEQF